MIDMIIAGIPVIGSIVSAITSMFNKPDIEMVEAVYYDPQVVKNNKDYQINDSYQEQDIIIDAKFIVTNHHPTSVLSISKANSNVTYSVLNDDHGEKITGPLYAKTIDFKPVNIEGGKTEQFQVRFVVSGKELEFVMRQVDTRGRLKEFNKLSPLILEMMLQRCDWGYFIMDIRDTAASKPDLMVWDVPIVADFHFRYGRNGSVHLREPVSFKGAKLKPLNVAWTLPYMK